MSWEKAVLWLREQPGQEELVRACYFDEPLDEAAERFHRGTEWTEVRNRLPVPPGRALDIGAGRGISSFALARDGWSVVALEPDRSEIVGAEAIRRLSMETGVAIEVSEAWGERLPFADFSFDLVYCRQALHHARDLPQLCREIGRVLKPGGVFVASREHVVSRKEDLKAFLESHPLHHLYGGENAYLLREYVEAIFGGGIVLTEVLNPFQSNINAHPETLDDIKRRLAERTRIPFLRFLPDRLLGWAGRLAHTPGRLYTFVGRRVADG